MRKRIAIIDEDYDICQETSKHICAMNHYSMLGSYNTYSNAIKSFRKSIPDIVFVDLKIKDDMDDLSFIRYLRSRYPPIQIIILTACDEVANVFSAFKAGVVGYLLKSDGIQSLHKALIQLGNGGAPMSPSISRIVVSSYHINSQSVLTKREIEVMNLLAMGKTYVEIASESGMSRLTSRVHIRNIYRKLNANSKAEAIRTAAHNKYISSQLVQGSSNQGRIIN